MRRPHSKLKNRRGVVLLLVLFCVPLLALGGYAFVQTMRVEASASNAAIALAQAKWSAAAGIEYARALLADPNNFTDSGINFNDDSGRFCAQPLGEGAPGTELFFSLMHVDPNQNDAIVYGLTSESAKIPLDNPALLNRREALLGLPNMTEEIADAILDWIDADETSRELGAESDYYTMQSPSYSPTNGAPKSLGELLLVKGVTPELLYGEDRNLNGKLDPEENDGDATWPPDNSDGTLDRGWMPYLTLHSSAANLNSKGEAKINLNNIMTTAASGNTGSSGGSTTGNSGATGAQGGQATAAPTVNEEVAKQLTDLFGEEFVNFLIAYKTSRGQIKTISELIDATSAPEQTQPGTGGQPNSPNQTTLKRSGPQDQNNGGMNPPLVSPWHSANMGDYLEKAMEECSTNDQPSVNGAIDVMLAPAEVIRALPGIDEQMATSIANSVKNRATKPASAAFLLTEELVTLEVFRQIEPYITTQGRVFRVESVGYSSESGPVARIEAIIDASAGIPKILSRRDMTSAGVGFVRKEFSGQATSP